MLGFVVAVVAGFLTPAAEETLARPVERALREHILLDQGERRLLAFVLVMLLAGVAANLLNSGSPFWVILGGALGYFGTRLVAAARRVLDARR
jgi:type IV secretory pathway TrbD component